MSKRPTITAQMKLDVIRAFGCNVMCWECRDWCLLQDIEFDHWLALVNGGSHTVENLRPICIPCHKIKSAREHIANCKAKRLAAGGKKRKGPPIKSRGFDKSKSKKFSGEVVERAK